jgi:peroxiredoxin
MENSRNRIARVTHAFRLDSGHGGFHSARMSAVNSTMLPLGTSAPDFRLPDTNGKLISLADFKGAPALVVLFICNHCPYVIHIRSELARACRDFQARGIAVVGISSNDAAGYPQDGPDKMREEVALAGYTFPYLYDETQKVAQAYRAACTPDFFVFDRDRRLFYRGQFDDARRGNSLPVTGKDLRAAVDAALKGTQIFTQKPSIGCNIKWKPGNEPDYFRL